IKRGIMEMADIVAVTKCDGENVTHAQLTRRNFLNALHLFPMPESEWRAEVYTCSSIDGSGLLDVWSAIERYISQTNKNGYFDVNRHRQAKYWMNETIREALLDNFYNSSVIQNSIEEMEQKVLDNKISSFVAAKELLDLYNNSVK
ncbi:MAG: methylmalonyl Co-A mutase-associated GTPase MeaB, partial [Rikenellaceae bacterium]